jgi:hypothetical protein
MMIAVPLPGEPGVPINKMTSAETGPLTPWAS